MTVDGRHRWVWTDGSTREVETDSDSDSDSDSTSASMIGRLVGRMDLSGNMIFYEYDGNRLVPSF